MCDFRKITAVKLNGLTIPIKETAGWFGGFGDPAIKDAVPGLYHVGMSGCGLYYWDGKNWYSDYEDNWYNYMNTCEFVSEGYTWEDAPNVQVQKEG